jgi:hypothetical protein
VRLLVPLLALLLLAAAPAPVEQAFTDGETLDYNLHWMKVAGGTGRMTIQPVAGAPGQLRITSVARSTPGFARVFRFRDEIETIIRKSDFSTLQYHKKLDERGRKKDELTTIAENGLATRIKGSKVRKFKVPQPILDPMSVNYFLRTLDLSPGKVHELELLADGKLYTVHAQVLRRETITTPAGTFKTVVVEPVMEAGGVARDERMLVWYSDDDRRLPVRIRTDVNFGSITATLRAWSPGVTSVEPVVAPPEPAAKP